MCRSGLAVPLQARGRKRDIDVRGEHSACLGGDARRRPWRVEASLLRGVRGLGRLTRRARARKLRGRAAVGSSVTMTHVQGSRRMAWVGAFLALAGLARRIETARGALDVARGRRKAVESLRERRHREWKLLQDRREVAAQDELATIAAFRRERDS